MRIPDYTNQFKRDYKASKKQRLNMSLLDKVLTDLIEENPLDKKYKDHPLVGDYYGCRECHILSDWLLIYQLGEGAVVFHRTGTHSKLFG